MKTLLYTLLVVIWSASTAFAQQRGVKGVVTDGKGEPLVGATILVKGTTTATSAGTDGGYQLTLPDGATTLVVSFVGANSQEIFIGSQSTINVTLSAAAQGLNEVVVVGYGTQKRSDITGAVASVQGEQLTQVATPDPVQALQGRTAGVEITANSGQPGAGTRIRVRGVGTINNSNPLYVVDGIQTGDIGFLLPSDIESLEILKDASATAIYGSRGANGVVLVTTKHGKSGETRFNLSGYTGYQELRRKLPLTTASQYATLISEAYTNDGKKVPFAVLQSAAQSGAVGTDYQDLVTQRGLITNYNLSASGGTDQNRFLVSGGYFQQDGILKASGLKKYVLRLNDDMQLTKRIKAGLGTNFTHSDAVSPGNGTLGLLGSAVFANPVLSPYNADGSYAYDNITDYVPNIARTIEERKSSTAVSNNLFTTAFLDVTLAAGLSVRSSFGINYNNYHSKVFLPQYFIGNKDNRGTSQLKEGRYENVAYVWSNYLTYQAPLGENNALAVTLGQEVQRDQNTGFGITVNDVPNDASLQFISAARNPGATFSSNQTDLGLVSYFGRFNYGFKEKYLLTGTLRYDQTSKFIGNAQHGYFPSFGAAWRISNEEFFKGISAISSLKLRGGFGEVGNQNAAPVYGGRANATNNQNYVFGGVTAPGLAITQLTNPNLKWERTVTTDVGLDADLLDNHFSFTADYFIRRTRDMIALAPTPDYLGLGPAAANVASLVNRGLELALSYRNVAGKFRYDVNVNLTKIHNEVTDLGGADPIASGNIISQLGNTTLTNVGREIAFFYGLKTDGIFHSQGEVDAYTGANGRIQPLAQPGDVKFVDVNGDGKIDDKDKTYLGSATPKFTYGGALTLGYGGFDFKVLLYGVQGTQAVNGLAAYLGRTADFTGTPYNFLATRLDRWTPANPNSNEPRLSSADANKNNRFSDRVVEDASYLRARNMELGYSLPKDFLGRYAVGGLRVFASVDNVFTVTKYRGFDPEISDAGYYSSPLAYGVDYGNYPQPRTYRLGLNVQF